MKETKTLIFVGARPDDESFGLGGTPERGLLGLIFHLSELFSGLFGEKDYYMQAYPEPGGRKREKDLFEGVKV